MVKIRGGEGSTCQDWRFGGWYVLAEKKETNLIVYICLEQNLKCHLFFIYENP